MPCSLWELEERERYAWGYSNLEQSPPKLEGEGERDQSVLVQMPQTYSSFTFLQIVLNRCFCLAVCPWDLFIEV